MKFVVIIPARLGSIRLPGKPLIKINGKPMILHVLENAYKSGAQRVIVATDHESIALVIKSVGGEVCMTDVQHKSGTERIAEVVEKYKFLEDTIIVNIQGDEPMIGGEILLQAAKNLKNNPEANVATFAVCMNNISEIMNPNIVKVIVDHKNYALYFSRCAIPYLHGNTNDDDQKLQIQKIKQYFLKHIGIYSYYAGFIKQYVMWQPCLLENIEKLEQLRILYYGRKIYISILESTVNISVDTPEDLKRVRDIMLT